MLVMDGFGVELARAMQSGPDGPHVHQCFGLAEPARKMRYFFWLEKLRGRALVLKSGS